MALAKRDTVDRLVSKAMNDKHVTDAEFQVISPEMEQCNILKERVRAKLTRKPSKQNVDSVAVDVEKIPKEARNQGRREAETVYAELAELRKKTNIQGRMKPKPRLTFDLKFENKTCNLRIQRK